MIRRSLLLTLALAVTACGGGKQVWFARPVMTPGVRIEPTQVVARGPLLYVETNVYNQSGVPVTVNRDAVALVLPNGAVLGRSQGTFSQHKGYVIPPGGMHAVHVDFRAEGFKWRDVPSASVDFGRGMFIDGSPIALPLMPVSPNAMPAAPVAPVAPVAPAPAAPPPANGIKIEGGVEMKTN